MKPVALPSLLILTPALVASYTPCALIGSYFPPPSASSIHKANLTDGFNDAFDNLVKNSGHDIYGEIFSNTTSFSVIYFSGTKSNVNEDCASIFEYQYTSPYDTAQGRPPVTADTKVPLAEVTMVLTVYAWLIKMSDHWSESIIKYLPDLKAEGGVFDIPWEDITIGDLAGHTSGLPRSSSTCTIGKPCDVADFLKDINNQGPTFLPHTTPAVSYAAFQILAMAIERAEESSYSNIMSEAIFEPLGMKNTSFVGQGKCGESKNSGLNITGHGEQAAISAVSTAKDLACAGNAMLSSKLISVSSTRKWLQRSVDSSNLRNGVGYPWEIYRSGNATKPIIDVLTKTGNIGSYASYFGLSQDFDVGFAILARDFTISDGKLDLNAYADVASESLLPLQKVAAAEMGSRYAGLYKSESGDALLLNVTGPGLEVIEMRSEDGDEKKKVAEVLGIKDGSLDFRLYPTNVQDDKRHQYVAVFQDRDAPVDAGTPTCITWQSVGSLESAPNKFSFELNETGVAISVAVRNGGKYLRTGTGKE